jgi:glycosyltransferase involved in cell wall biosynthesis
MQVSIIIPCYNEEKTIQLLLHAIRQQRFPKDQMEVIIADGMSLDGTRAEIELFQREYPDLKVYVIDNPDRSIPHGLNHAIRVARGETLIRLDAHSIPDQDYVSLCVKALDNGNADIVGGVWEIHPSSDGWVQRAIAWAAAHYLGVGDAHYRVGSIPRAVDTVPFGAYKRRLIDLVGMYDESLLANEDYEFATRVRKSGGVVWLDPAIKSIYFARSTFSALAKQYWRYGFWKVKMLVRYPETMRWRQLSGGFVLSWLVLIMLSLWLPVARWLLILEAIIYGSALMISGFQIARRENDWQMMFGVPIAISTMHFSWGSGFLWSVIDSSIKAVRTRRFKR